jgi:ADP-dependent NAD(P)H-hydrate dehydratase / NAD(P)H-hydrate epimerase
MKAVTAETMQQLDRQTIEQYGVPGLELMERAGRHVAETVTTRFAGSGNRSALIFAGKGNNGGDGFVVARLLAGSGWSASLVILTSPEEFTGDAKKNLDRIPPSVSTLLFSETSKDKLLKLAKDNDVIIDAIFGTGLKSAPSGIFAEAVEVINSSGKPVIAVDIPSGVDATSGKTCGVAVRAGITVTFGSAKLGHILYPGAEFAGEIIVTDIGIPAELLAKAPFVEYIDKEFASTLIKRRKKTAHKGSYGHTLIIAGSCGKSGAAAMAANSAMRSGAGLVTLAVPCCIHPVVELKTTEAMTVPLKETPGGTLALKSLAELRELLAGKEAVAIGPGLGLHEETKKVAREIVSTAGVPLVIDADAINAVAEDLSCLKASASPALILTPHPGEMARLTGVSITEIESDRIKAAGSFARGHNCHLLLKGARTVIAAPDGRVAINGSGNPGMASGGMGDVLTGVIAALLGQGYEPFDACCLGAFCHGFSGDMAEEEKGEIGMIATDVQELLPYVFKQLLKKQSPKWRDHA